MPTWPSSLVLTALFHVFFRKPCCEIHPPIAERSGAPPAYRKIDAERVLPDSQKTRYFHCWSTRGGQCPAMIAPIPGGFFSGPAGDPMDQRLKDSRRVTESNKCSWCGWIKAGMFWTPDRRSPSVAMLPNSICPGCREDHFWGAVAPRDTGSWLGH